MIDWCKGVGAVAVAGNHDREICAQYRAGRANAPYTFAEQHLSVMKDSDVSYLEALPDSRTVDFDGFSFFVTHYYGDDKKNRFALFERWMRFDACSLFEEIWPVALPSRCRIIMTGHSHQSMLFRVSDQNFFINPGSISYRENGDYCAKGADYAIFQDGEIALKHIDYDRSVFYDMLAGSPLRPDIREWFTLHVIRDTL